MQVSLLTEFAQVPTRGTSGSAGYDLYSATHCIIPKRERALVDTGIAISIPENTYARIAPRSGLAVKNGIDVGAGVVDYDYRGSIGVLLFNHSDSDFTVNIGDRIAQLIIEKILTPEILVVSSLDETKRGNNGFGSTGI